MLAMHGLHALGNAYLLGMRVPIRHGPDANTVANPRPILAELEAGPQPPSSIGSICFPGFNSPCLPSVTIACSRCLDQDPSRYGCRDRRDPLSNESGALQGGLPHARPHSADGSITASIHRPCSRMAPPCCAGLARWPGSNSSTLLNAASNTSGALRSVLFGELEYRASSPADTRLTENAERGTSRRSSFSPFPVAVPASIACSRASPFRERQLGVRIEPGLFVSGSRTLSRKLSDSLDTTPHELPTASNSAPQCVTSSADRESRSGCASNLSHPRAGRENGATVSHLLPRADVPPKPFRRVGRTSRFPSRVNWR